MGLPPQPVKPVQPIGAGDLRKHEAFDISSRIPIALGALPLDREVIAPAADIITLVPACPNGVHRIVVDACGWAISGGGCNLVLAVVRSDASVRYVAVNEPIGDTAAGTTDSSINLRRPITLEPGESLICTDTLAAGATIDGGAGYLDVML